MDKYEVISCIYNVLSQLDHLRKFNQPETRVLLFDNLKPYYKEQKQLLGKKQSYRQAVYSLSETLRCHFIKYVWQGGVCDDHSHIVSYEIRKLLLAIGIKKFQVAKIVGHHPDDKSENDAKKNNRTYLGHAWNFIAIEDIDLYIEIDLWALELHLHTKAASDNLFQGQKRLKFKSMSLFKDENGWTYYAYLRKEAEICTEKTSFDVNNKKNYKDYIKLTPKEPIRNGKLNQDNESEWLNARKSKLLRQTSKIMGNKKIDDFAYDIDTDNEDNLKYECIKNILEKRKKSNHTGKIKKPFDTVYEKPWIDTQEEELPWINKPIEVTKKIKKDKKR